MSLGAAILGIVVAGALPHVLWWLVTLPVRLYDLPSRRRQAKRDAATRKYLRDNYDPMSKYDEPLL